MCYVEGATGNQKGRILATPLLKVKVSGYMHLRLGVTPGP